MTSTRPTTPQLEFDFSNEADWDAVTSELQTEQSSSAAMKKSALDSVSNDLMEKIVDDAKRERAWKKVKANKGAPGPDGIALDEFFETFRHHWPETRRQLLEGTYQPGPCRRKSISKPDGGTRDLGIPTVTGKSTPVQSAFGLR
jgi:RNA-directed DNA polymerase